MNSKLFGVLAISGLLVSCTTAGTRNGAGILEKKVIEMSYRAGQEPPWLRDSRMSWDDGDQHFIRASYTVAAQQRINGCMDLAKAEGKESLISEIANDIKGEIVRASQGLDAGEDEGLSKTWIEKFQGDTRGLRFSEAAYERAIVNDVEHVECFVLGRIKNSDYAQIKNRILAGAAKTDTRIRKILEERQARMLSSDVSPLAAKPTDGQ